MEHKRNEQGFHHIGLVIVVFTLAVIGFAGWRVFKHNASESSAAKQSAKADVPAKTIDKTGAFKLQGVSVGGCNATIPSGWNQPTTNETYTTFDAFSPDKSMYVGYGHPAVNTALAPYASAYSPPLNDPDLYSSDPSTMALAYAKIAIAALGGDTAVSFVSETNEKIGDYQLRSVSSSTHKGLVFFHNAGYPGNGINYTYSLPMYFAVANNSAWQSSGLSLAKMSASISCSAKLVARASGPDIGGSSSSDSKSDENDSDSGYNPQLGTEYVHDPTTGENYLVDPSRDWSSSGPDGGGYYKTNGNDYTQLQPGRSD